MFKKRKKITANQIKWLSIFIIVILFLFLGIGYAKLNQKIEIKGKANKNESVQSNKEIVIKMETITGPSWYYYTLAITITNLKKYDIDGWTISMTVPEDTTIAGNEKIKVEKQNSTIYLKSVTENSYLAINKSTSFTVEILTQKELYIPSDVKFNGVSSVPEIITKKEKSNKQIEKKIEGINNNLKNNNTIEENEKV